MLEVRACPVWFALGVPCPGCGLVRASLALATGQLAEAGRLHPLVFVAVPAALYAPFRRRPYPRSLLPAALVLLLATWGLRLATGTHPDGFHPESGAFARAWRYVAAR